MIRHPYVITSALMLIAFIVGLNVAPQRSVAAPHPAPISAPATQDSGLSKKAAEDFVQQCGPTAAQTFLDFVQGGAIDLTLRQLVIDQCRDYMNQQPAPAESLSA